MTDDGYDKVIGGFGLVVGDGMEWDGMDMEEDEIFFFLFFLLLNYFMRKHIVMNLPL